MTFLLALFNKKPQPTKTLKPIFRHKVSKPIKADWEETPIFFGKPLPKK